MNLLFAGRRVINMDHVLHIEYYENNDMSIYFDTTYSKESVKYRGIYLSGDDAKAAHEELNKERFSKESNDLKDKFKKEGD
jgi:hypothetical protein